MATVIDALLVTLGLDNSKFTAGVGKSVEDLKKLENESSGTAERMKGLGATAGEFYGQIRMAATAFFAAVVGKGFMAFMDEISDTDRGLGRLAEKLKLNVQELNTYQQALVKVGGSVEEFNNDTKGLGNILRDIEYRIPGMAEGLFKLHRVGVSGVRWGQHTDMLKVLDQLAARASVSGRAALWIQQQMGFSDSMMRLLKMGPTGIAQLRKEMGELSQVTEEEIKNDNAWAEAKRTLGAATTQIGRTIAASVIPVLGALSEHLLRLSRWAVQHKDVIRATFIGLAVAVGIAGTAAAIAAIPISIIAIKILLIAAAIGLVAGGVTWLVLKYKQWMTAGQESMTMLGKFFAMIRDGWASIRDTLGLALGTMWDMVKLYFNVFMVDELRLFFALFSGDSEKISKAWTKLMEDLEKLFKLVMKAIRIALFTLSFVMLDIWNDMWEKMKKAPTEFIKWIASKALTLFQFTGVPQALIGSAIKMQMKDSAKGVEPSDAIARLRGSAYAGGAGAKSIQQENNIGQVTVVLPNAMDAAGMIKDVGPALKQQGLSSYTMIPFVEGWR